LLKNNLARYFYVSFKINYMKIRIVTAVGAMLFIAIGANAQSMGETYKSALGIKVWDGAGISYKQFTNKKNWAVEGIGFFWRDGFRVTGLYEFHGPINGADGLQYYIGPGAHIGFYDTGNGNKAILGLDGVLGLDYKIKGAPINVSLDWQPSIEFSGGRGFNSGWGGLGVRFTF
jgi:hypothetical protein